MSKRCGKFVCGERRVSDASVFHSVAAPVPDRDGLHRAGLDGTKPGGGAGSGGSLANPLALHQPRCSHSVPCVYSWRSLAPRHEHRPQPVTDPPPSIVVRICATSLTYQSTDVEV